MFCFVIIIVIVFQARARLNTLMVAKPDRVSRWKLCCVRWLRQVSWAANLVMMSSRDCWTGCQGPRPAARSSLTGGELLWTAMMIWMTCDLMIICRERTFYTLYAVTNTHCPVNSCNHMTLTAFRWQYGNYP